MFFRALRDLARPQILAIVDTLKRSDGMAVGDLADSLKMSYMGVKQYCIELEKRGYLDTWRRPRETGRPELTYRLTPKAQVLFPQHATELSLEVLEAVRQLHGATAAVKILYQYFLKKTEAYSKKIKGQSLAERATSLAKLRDAEGHCAQVEYDAKHGLRLVEFHSPLAELIRQFPSVARMEDAMLSRVLQAPVQRDATAVSGLMRITFLIAGATQPPPAPPSTGVRSRPTAHRKKKSPVPSVPEPQELPAAAVAADSSTEPVDAPREAEGTLAAETVCPQPPDAPHEEAAVVQPTVAVVAMAEEPAESAAPIPAGAVLREEEAMDRVEPESPPAATPAEATPARDRRDAEPLLFSSLEPAAPRLHARAVAPARQAVKPTGPVAEELFLSL